MRKKSQKQEAQMFVEPLIARRIQKRHNLAKKCRAQADELTNRRLAAKMNTSIQAIAMIANGVEPPKSHGLNHADVRLIRSCISERDRLRSLASDHTVARMAVEYRLHQDVIHSLIGEAHAEES